MYPSAQALSMSTLRMNANFLTLRSTRTPLTHFLSCALLGLLLFPCWGWASAVWSPKKGLEPRGGLAEKVLTSEQSPHLRAGNLMEQAQAHAQQGHFRKALKGYQYVVEKFPNSDAAPLAMMACAKIFRKKGQLEKAFKKLQTLLGHYPGFNGYDQVIDQQAQIIDSLIKRKRRGSRWLSWIGGVSHKRLIEYNEALIENAPFLPVAEQAFLNIAQLYCDDKQYDKAVAALDQLVSRYPQSSLRPQAMLKIANIHRNLVSGPAYAQGSTNQAIQAYKDLMSAYPDTPQAQDAQIALESMKVMLAQSKLDMGDFYWRSRSNPKSAAIFYREALSIAPDTPSGEQAERNLIQIQSGIPLDKTFGEKIFGRYQSSGNDDQNQELQVRIIENTEVFGPNLDR